MVDKFNESANMLSKADEIYATQSQKIAAFLIDALTRPSTGWRPGWKYNPINVLPHNAVTNRPYGGWNLFVLMLDQRDLGTCESGWLTKKQAARLNVDIYDGASPALVQYIDINKRWARTWEVYNLSQTTGFKIRDAPIHTWNPIHRVDKIVANSNARVLHHARCSVPHYTPKNDQISMPERDVFLDSCSYYRTLLHELAHWTGHISRCNRFLHDPPMCYEDRAREELYAEIASMLLGMEFGIGHDLDNHAEYVRSWVRILRDSEKEIHKAVAIATKIQMYIKQFDVRPEDCSSAKTSDQWSVDARISE